MGSLIASLSLLQVTCEYGMVHVVSQSGGPKGKDYCILYNPQWAHLPQDLSKAVSTCRSDCALCTALTSHLTCCAVCCSHLACAGAACRKRLESGW
jgi:signal peptide peptidase-like protein 2B